MARTPSGFRRVQLQLCVLLVGLGVLLPFGHVGAQAQRKTLKVLFIGNSYTFYNNLGDIVAGISRSKKDGPIIDATIATVPNEDLAWHLQNGPAVRALEKGGWDFVNIQETSLLPGGSQAPAGEGRGGAPARGRGGWIIGDPARPGGFYESAREWVKRIRAKGATPLLEMTWARRDNPGTMQEDLAKIFDTLGNELGVKVAPAGLAWQEARWRLRTVDLYFRDGSHPLQTGSYLTASVIYATITAHDPRGAASVIMGHPVSNDGVVDMEKTVPLVDLPQATARELQKIAWETVSARSKPVSSARGTPSATASARAAAGR